MPLSKRFSWMPGVIPKLLPRLLDRTVTAAELWEFIRSRISGYRTTFTVAGMGFAQPDYNAWHQTFAIFFLREYAKEGFDVRPGDVVVDIGANRGVFTAYAAAKKAAEILAFEPDGENFAALDRLIRENALAATACNVAVGAFTGPVRLYKAVNHTRHTLSGRDLLTGTPLTAYDRVEALCLDEALGTLPRIDLLKIDCEGGEFDILAAAAPATLAKVSRIIMEYHCEADSPKIQQLAEILESAGFRVSRIPERAVPLGMLFAHRPTLAG